MTGRKNAGVLIGLVLAVSLIASAVTAMFMAEFNNRMHFQFIGHLFRELTEEQPDMEQTVLNVLKEYSDTTAMQKRKMYCSVMATGSRIFLRPPTGIHICLLQLVFQQEVFCFFLHSVAGEKRKRRV